MVAKIVRQDIVPRVVEDFVVGNKIDLKVISGHELTPGLEVRGDAGAVEPVRVVGDDDLVGAFAGDEPAFQRDAVVGGEVDVFKLEALFVWEVHDWGEGPAAEVVDDGFEGGPDLFI
jgi:hypothetical protein